MPPGWTFARRCGGSFPESLDARQGRLRVLLLISEYAWQLVVYEYHWNHASGWLTGLELNCNDLFGVFKHVLKYVLRCHRCRRIKSQQKQAA